MALVEPGGGEGRGMKCGTHGLSALFLVRFPGNFGKFLVGAGLGSVGFCKFLIGAGLGSIGV